MHAEILDDGHTALIQPCTPEELFCFQRERLAEKNLTPVGAFDHFAGRLPEQGPFLLVPPQPPFPNWGESMTLVKGLTGLNPDHFENLIDVPDVPTMLIDIEDGRGRLNVSPSASREAILAEGRIAYCTWWGLIHLFLFSRVLEHHYLDMVGSCFGQFVLGLYLDDNNMPRIHERFRVNVAPRWGAPSCGRIER